MSCLFFVEQHYLVLSTLLAMQNSQWTQSFIPSACTGLCRHAVLQICAGGSHRSLSLSDENARLESFRFQDCTESLDCLTYYQHICMCVETIQWAGKTKHYREEAFVLATIPSPTGSKGLISLLGWALFMPFWTSKGHVKPYGKSQEKILLCSL